MKIDPKNALIVVLALVALKPLVFPKRELRPIPTIVTKYDTVKTVDTAWVTKTKVVHDTTNVIERVVVSVPETVKVVPALKGLTSLYVPSKFGDTTKALGFEVRPDSTGSYLYQQWSTEAYTPGPLASVYIPLNGKPVLGFNQPPRACHEIKAFGEGAAAITLLRLLLGR